MISSGDGDFDIIAADEGGDAIRLENNGAANPSLRNSLASSVDGPWHIFPIDLDQDGDMDVVAASHVDNKVRWFSNNGAADPSFTAATILSNVDARGVHAGDIDGDGDIDIAVAGGGPNKVYWLENNGSQSFTSNSFGSDTNPRSVFIFDVDKDGEDLAAAYADSDKVKLYENDGAADPSFNTNILSTSIDGAMSVYAADMDNDGDADILAAAQEEDKTTGLKARSSRPQFFSNDNYSSADGIYSVYAKDLDNDGDMDIMSASANDDKIAWYENNGAADPVLPPARS